MFYSFSKENNGIFYISLNSSLHMDTFHGNIYRKKRNNNLQFDSINSYTISSKYLKFNFHKYFISRCFNAHTRTHIFGFSDSGIFFFSQQYLKLTWQLARFMAFNFIRQCLANCFESETESCKQYCVCVNDRQLGTDMVSKIAATCSKFHIVY